MQLPVQFGNNCTFLEGKLHIESISTLGICILMMCLTHAEHMGRCVVSLLLFSAYPIHGLSASEVNCFVAKVQVVFDNWHHYAIQEIELEERGGSSFADWCFFTRLKQIQPVIIYMYVHKFYSSLP